MSHNKHKDNKDKDNKVYKGKLSNEVGKIIDEIPEIKVVPDEPKADEPKADEPKADTHIKGYTDEEIETEEIADLQAQIAEQELLESQLKAKRKAIKLLAETVLTPERYQKMLDNHLGKIDAAQIAFDELAPDFYRAKRNLTEAINLKDDFIKLYGSRKIQHRDGKKIGARWADTLTKTNDTLVVETTLKDHQGKFSYDLPVSPQKEILQQAWKDLRHGFIDFFDGEDDKVMNLTLRGKLSGIHDKIIKAGLVFID